MRHLSSYALGAVSVAACAAVGLGLGALTGGRAYVIQFLIAVAIAAWHGGRGPALATTALVVVVSEMLAWGAAPAAAALPQDQVRIALMVVVALAITGLAGSLHEARAAQRREAERMRAFMGHLPAAMIVFDAHGRMLQANDKVREILGHDAHDLTRPWQAYAEDGRPIPPEEYTSARALRGEHVYKRRILYRRGDDGEQRWIEASAVPMMEEGRIAGAVTIFFDVTEQVAMEAELDASRGNLEIALAASRMGRWHLDLRNMAMEASDTCRANFGRMPGEAFTYDDVVAAVHPDDRPGMQQAVQRAIAERRDYATEYRVAWPDGTQRWIAARGRAKYDEAGTPVAMDGVTIDFTGRKKTEDDLRAASLRLQEAGRRKDQFLAVLGHELRNPLAPMRTAVELLRLQGEEERVRQRTVAVLDRQTAQLGSLVDELLDVARIAEGKVRLERETLELASVLEQALETSEPLIHSRRHSVRLTMPPPGTLVDGDRARLVQVMTNLLNNAAKYTDAGGMIELRGDVVATVAVVSVRDNGIGIAPESIEELFEVFSQVDGSLDRSQGGLGLGLNVARRLVEMHGGTIAAHSDGPGRGSTFTVTLPLVSAPVISRAST